MNSLELFLCCIGALSLLWLVGIGRDGHHLSPFEDGPVMPHRLVGDLARYLIIAFIVGAIALSNLGGGE